MGPATSMHDPRRGLGKDTEQDTRAIFGDPNNHNHAAATKHETGPKVLTKARLTGTP